HDARIAAGYPMDGNGGGYVTADGYNAVDVPMLMITAHEDGEADTGVWDVVTGDVSWVSLDGGCHQTFALGGCSDMDTHRGYEVVNGYGLAFARKAVLGDNMLEEILDGTQALDDAATVWTR
ncbi:MAG: hypothetical protein GY913_00810, partial [Proteobacteria bacterium]|nr:hypothetical protein [Pseudomonadota bacterium]